MTRILIAAILGAVVHFGYGAFAWIVAPWHTATMNFIDNEREAIDQLEQHLPHDGVYFFPGMSHNENMTALEQEQAWNEFTEHHREGPIGMIFYRAEGAEPMPPTTFAIGFVLSLVATLLASAVVFVARPGLPSYSGGVLLVTLLGIFVAINAPLTGWNWMWVPTDHTLASVLDFVLAWLLVGLVISAIVKGPTKAGSASATASPA